MNGAITDVLLNMAPPPKNFSPGVYKKVTKAFFGSNWSSFPALPISWLGFFPSDPIGNIFKQSNRNLQGKKFWRTAALTRTFAALSWRLNAASVYCFLNQGTLRSLCGANVASDFWNSNRPQASDPRTWELAAPTIDPTSSWLLPRSTAIGWLNEEDRMSSWHLWWGPPAPTFWDHCQQYDTFVISEKVRNFVPKYRICLLSFLIAIDRKYIVYKILFLYIVSNKREFTYCTLA